jgi:hypothetical protein
MVFLQLSVNLMTTVVSLGLSLSPNTDQSLSSGILLDLLSPCGGTVHHPNRQPLLVITLSCCMDNAGTKGIIGKI